MKAYTAPTKEELEIMIGKDRFIVWHDLCDAIDSHYEMDCLWNDGGKRWSHEYKYRRGGKTLCALYAKEGDAGFMVILGKYERERFEADRPSYTQKICEYYDAATTYHDGKWILFPLDDMSLIDDYIRLLFIKRKPNKIANNN